jgi:nicotinamide-nucleotide amidase
MLPAGSRTLENQMGTAPGFVTPFVVDGRTVEVWSFPGVPREYEHLRDDHLIPAIRARLDAGRPTTLVRRTLRSLGLAESAIGERLKAFEAAHPEVRVQYRAAYPEIIIRLVLEVPADADLGEVGRRADTLAREAKDAIGKSVWGTSDDPLEVRVLELARARGLTIGTAESCTGGLIAKRLTDVPGSSDVVVGGVVSYANSVKQAVLDVSGADIGAHGAVSAVVAEAMARGARHHLRADLTISVTGVAGPGGGTPEKPVGTVWFGLASADGTTSVMKKFPDFGRERIREMTAATALRLLLEHLEGTTA